MFIVFVFTTNLILSTRRHFFSIVFILRNWAHETDHWTRRQRYARYICLWRQQSREEILVLFGTTLFQIADCVSVPIFCHFVDHLWMLFENSSFKNLWRINCLGWNFVQCGRIHFTLSKIMNKLGFTTNRVFISLVGPCEAAKSKLFHHWLQIGIFPSKFDKVYFF